MRDGLFNEGLFFSLDRARSAIAEWAAVIIISGRTHCSVIRPGSYAGCTHRAIWRIQNRRSSNRRWIKAQWYVNGASARRCFF